MQAATKEARLYQAALDKLIELGIDLATRIHEAATGPEPTLTLDQASTALDRTARTVRRTVLLARRLHDLPALDRITARRHVIRGVEDAIHRATTQTPDRRDSLSTELQERLDRPEFEADLNRPIPDLIEELARDLGVNAQGRTYVFPRRTPIDIETLLAKARGTSPPDVTRPGAMQRLASIPPSCTPAAWTPEAPCPKPRL